MNASTSPAAPAAILARLVHDMAALHARLPGTLAVPRPVFDAAGLRVHTLHIASQDELVSCLRDWGGCGWVEESDAVHVVTAGQALGAVAGVVLSADLARDGMGLRVRPAAGGWTLSTLEVVAANADGAESVLLRTVQHASVRGDDEVLRYRVASVLFEGNLRPLDAWFTGFAELPAA